jgi:hypothetical protein
MPSIIVSRPQFTFSQRLKDPSLHRLTITQLRKKARERRLDVSCLIHKWEFVHVLLAPVPQFVENGIALKRKTIFDLPGEIRNEIYGYMLVSENLITAQYGKVSSGAAEIQSSHPARHLALAQGVSVGPPPALQTVQALPTPVSQLLNLSLVNRELRREVRGFFFAHNAFEVKGSKGCSHLTFLTDIGADGRANIAKLNLSGTHFLVNSADFNNYLGTCINLRDLKVRMHLRDIADQKSYAALRGCIAGHTQEWKKNGFYDTCFAGMHIFTLLQSLQKLHVNVTVTDWMVLTLFSLFGFDRPRRTLVISQVKHTVQDVLERVLEGKHVVVQVEAVIGAPWAAWEKEDG